MLEVLFKLLATRLRTIAALKEVGWYMGQPRDKTSNLYTAPGAYIQLLPMNLVAEQGMGQRGTLEIRVYTVGVNLITTDERLAADNATDHVRLVNAVYEKLQGFKALLSTAEGYGALAGTEDDYYVLNTLQRTVLEPDHNWGPLNVTPQTFNSFMRWRESIPATDPAQPTIEVNDE